jgi:hypothetical protein
MNFNFITLDDGTKRCSHRTKASDSPRQRNSLQCNSTTFNTGGVAINLQQRQRQQVFPSSLLFDLLSAEIPPNTLSTLLFPFLPPQTKQQNTISLHLVVFYMQSLMLFIALTVVKLVFGWAENITFFF